MTQPVKVLFPTHLRVSDADREVVAERLRTAAAEGRLTMTEADERQALAYAALTGDDLAGLTTDLPDPPRPTAPHGELTRDARRRLVVHAAAVGVIAVLLLTRWIAGAMAFGGPGFGGPGFGGPAVGGPGFFWPIWPMFWLALSLFVHYRRARRATP